MAKKLFDWEAGWVSLDYIKRWPHTWRSEKVRNGIVAIQSDNGYWREDSAGYTYRHTAAAYLGYDAIRQTLHCGPEKRVRFHFYDNITKENRDRDLAPSPHGAEP